MNSLATTMTSIRASGAAEQPQPAIQVTGLVEDYSRGSSQVHALRSVSRA